MTRAGAVENMYREVADIEYLRAVIDALTGLVAEIEIDPEVTSSIPGVDRPRVAGQRAVRALALRRRQWAVDRVTQLIGKTAHRCPVMLDPIDQAPILSTQGQPLTPLITTGTAGTTSLSSAQVWMPPGHVSHAHVHLHTDVGIVVLQGKAITLWWDVAGVMHEFLQSAGQHLHIPFGTPHAAVNPFGQPVVATEWRSNRIFNADNERIPALDAEVRAREAAAA
jgi:uncharacterized RmlC-like cupin family protein